MDSTKLSDSFPAQKSHVKKMEDCISKINLKPLPLPDPAALTSQTSQVKKEKPNLRDVGEAEAGRFPVAETLVKKFDDDGNTRADLLAEADSTQVREGGGVGGDEDIKYMDPTSVSDDETIGDDSGEASKPPAKGEASKPPAKSHLHEICAAYRWKPPTFECCNEEGMCHSKLFTFKVIIEIEDAHGTGTVLECFGAPRPKKKTAAEHAAEGAFWYLKQIGYFPINKSKKRNSKKSEEGATAKHEKSKPNTRRTKVEI